MLDTADHIFYPLDGNVKNKLGFGEKVINI